MNRETPYREDEVLGDDAGSIRVSYHEAHVRVVLTGEVDARLNAQLAKLTTQLVEHGRTVEIVTRDVTFIDSAVIALVAHLANRLPARVRFLAPTDSVRFLLDLTQVGEIVDIIEPVVPTPASPPFPLTEPAPAAPVSLPFPLTEPAPGADPQLASS